MAWIYEHVIYVAGTKDTEERAVRVVCKVTTSTYGKGLLMHEADFYEKQTIIPLWGQIIPEYFGLFQTPIHAGDDASSGAKALCLVLEHGGNHLPIYEDGLRDQTIRFQ